MYRALYPFQKTHPTSLSFVQGDVFLSLPGARSDKNWHFVLDEKGCKGFVPRNYVNPAENLPNKDEYDKLLAKIREAVLVQRMSEKERADILGKIEELKKGYNSGNGKDNKLEATEKGVLRVPKGGSDNGASENEFSSSFPKAPSPRPDSLSSNEDTKGNINYNLTLDKHINTCLVSLFEEL